MDVTMEMAARRVTLLTEIKNLTEQLEKLKTDEALKPMDVFQLGAHLRQVEQLKARIEGLQAGERDYWVAIRFLRSLAAGDRD